jgi:3D (Asp-Asp-Asp) domain-containing protein
VKKTAAIILLITLLAVMATIMAAREFFHLERYGLQLQKYENSQDLYLKNVIEFAESYNRLRRDYLELDADYERLNKDLLQSGWKIFEVTGYSANDITQGTSDKVAAGFDLDHKNVKNLPIIATDPTIIPLYSIVEIEDLGPFISLDTGGAIKGNRIDILFENKDLAFEFGRKNLLARIIR